MKKLFSLILLFVTVSLCTGCRKQALPAPSYPLDAGTIEAALERLDLPWTITNRVDWGEGRVYYDLCNEDQKGIAQISSVADGTSRVLQINFFSSTAIDAPLPADDWEKAIRLAAVLYGGFSDDKQIYETFQSTYEEASLTEPIPGAIPKDQERIRWNQEIGKTHCFIGLRRQNVDSDSPKTELVSILLR
ncbi:MAG: hypothetical protein PHV18_03705 [Lachnospiraceae bacterium]|nr:hypothetical protein [Lachnospiraceae bacterium]